MPDKKTNWITFRLTNWEVNFVHLSGGGVVRHGGLEPDSWTFIVAASELAKLGIDDDFPDVSLAPIVGELGLWYDNEPNYVPETPADVVLGNVAIVSIEPDEIGIAKGDSEASVISYAVTIMDHRRIWVEPRGGRLFDGIVNRHPLGPGETLKTNEQLINACADAMGVVVTVPSGVNDAEPARNLDWRGEHAPTALQELLEHVGFVYCPTIAGVGQIMLPGSGSAPSIPSERIVQWVTSKSVDRRARKVILISAPNAKIHTYKSAAEETPAWQFVIQDPADDQWKPLADVSVLTSAGGALQVWQKQFDNLTENDQKRVRDQLYCCIQLDPERYPPGKVNLLPNWFDTDVVPRVPFLGPTDELLVQDDRGSYGQHNDEQPLLSKQVFPEANVLVFPHPLMKLTGSDPFETASHLTGVVVPMAEEDLKPTFSVEACDDTTYEVEYAVFGFSVASFTMSSMSESDAKDYLTGAHDEAAIYQYDDLIQVIVNPDDATPTTNRDAMEDRAETYARQLVPLATPAMEVIIVKGFLAVELTGAVSEVAYDRESVTTTITLNGWHCAARIGGDSYSDGPSSGDTSPARSITKRRSRRRDAARKRSLHRSSRLGTNDTAKLVEPSRPAVRPSLWPELVLVNGASAIASNNGRFEGKFFGAKVLPSAAGNLALADIGAESGPCEIWHMDAAGTGAKLLRSSDLLLAFLGPPNTTRLKPIAVTLPGQIPCTLFPVALVKVSGSNGNGTTAPTWVYQVKTLAGVEIAASLSPQAGREKGYFVEATRGLAYIDGGSIVLYHAFEARDVTGCGGGE